MTLWQFVFALVTGATGSELIRFAAERFKRSDVEKDKFTAFLTSELQAMRDEIAPLRERVAVLEDTVRKVTDERDAFEAKSLRLEGTLAAVTEERDRLKEQIEALRLRR